MKYIYISTFILFFINSTSAQVTFEKSMGGADYDWSRSMVSTNDNGYVFLGQTKSFGSGDINVFLLKINSDGDTLWSRTYGRTGSQEGIFLQHTNDGGFIITGFATKYPSGLWTTILIKTDSIGNLQWIKNYGGANNDNGESVFQTNDGGYVIFSTTSSYGMGDWDMYLIRTDANGNIIWTKTYGGPATDFAENMIPTSDGGYLLLGTSANFGAGNTDVLVVKTDSGGNPQWSKTYGGMNYDFGRTIKQTFDGGYILAGYCNSDSTFNGDIYLIKTDSQGDTMWTKTFEGGAHFNTDVMYSVLQTTDSGYVVAGPLVVPGGTKSFLLKTDKTGNPLWTMVSDSFVVFTLAQTADGGFVLSGYSFDFYYDVFVMKTDLWGESNCSMTGYNIISVSNDLEVNSVNPSLSFGVGINYPVYTQTSGCNVTVNCSSVQTKEITEDKTFNIFPNPSSGNFTIQFTNLINEGSIEIINSIGAMIQKENIYPSSEINIALGNVANGIYFLKLSDGKNNFSKKLIINKN